VKAEIRIPAWLESAIEISWAPETSFYPSRWNSDNPALGQCAVTAILLSELCGLQVVRGTYRGNRRHYWNVDEDGNIIDMTLSQFPPGMRFHDEQVVNPKAMLKNKLLMHRYTLLREAVLGMEP